MPLFSDGKISDIDDLRAYDSALLDMAGAEGVDLGAKLSVATAELGVELEEFLRKRAGSDSGSLSQTNAELSHVVVTPALKQWHTLRALSLIYGDVRSRHLNSRYEGKWKEYKRSSQWAAEMLFRTGVGLVHVPMARAETPEVRVLSGTLPATTYLVKVAWRNRLGETGAASETVVKTLDDAGVLGVKAVDPPENAVSFDVYIGCSETQITSQNDSPVEPGQEWIMPETGLTSGADVPAGQDPDWWLRDDRILRRG
jgi:hypothetical protein